MNKTKSIALCGLITALHIIATLLLKFSWVPGLDLIILFLVPFFSAQLAIKAKPRYILVFAIASLLVCGVLDIQSCLLYILPTISVGIAYGYCVKKKVDGTSIVYILTLLEFGLFFLSSYLVKLFFKLDVIETACKILHFTNTNMHLGLGFLLAYSFAQAFLVHIITKSELKKTNIEVVKTKHPSFFILVLGILALASSFIPYKTETWVFFSCICAIVFGLPLALYGYQATEKPWIILAVQAGVFLVATLPILKALETSTINYQATSAYLLIALPPIAFAVYKLLKEDYSK